VCNISRLGDAENAIHKNAENTEYGKPINTWPTLRSSL